MTIVSSNTLSPRSFSDILRYVKCYQPYITRAIKPYTEFIYFYVLQLKRLLEWKYSYILYEDDPQFCLQFFQSQTLILVNLADFLSFNIL